MGGLLAFFAYRNILVVVREKGFLPVRQETTFSSTGRSVAANLVADTIVE